MQSKFNGSMPVNNIDVKLFNIWNNFKTLLTLLKYHGTNFENSDPERWIVFFDDRQNFGRWSKWVRAKSSNQVTRCLRSGMRGMLCRNIVLNVCCEEINVLLYDQLDVEFRSFKLQLQYRAWCLVPLDVGH